jgi:hypothetical protein
VKLLSILRLADRIKVPPAAALARLAALAKGDVPLPE